MKTLDQRYYTDSFTVDQSPAEVFAAINNVRGWWSGEVDGSTDQLGAEFTYRYKDIHYSKQKITELVPEKKVAWHVLDSQLTFVEEQDEWTDTHIVFEISRKDGKTELLFTHIGLVPTFACYKNCSGAWGSLITESLHDLITTGKGYPAQGKDLG
jgi:hypothetical protein